MVSSAWGAASLMASLNFSRISWTFWGNALMYSSTVSNRFLGVAIFSSPLLIGLLQTFNLNFLHLKHCFHDPFHLYGIRVLHHPFKNSGNDAPRHAIFVLQPTALLFLPAFGKLL